MDDSENKVGPASPEASQDKKTSSFWKELVKLILLALLIVVPFRYYVAQPFIVDGASMDPTFKTGQYLVVDEVTYHFKDPARGSVLIFRYPKDPSKFFIKRIIGLPGETISLNKGQVTIKNEANPKGFKLDEPYVQLKKADTVDYVLGENEYFVMGDNRIGSADSRIWGPVPIGNFIGRPIIRFFPPSFWPGDSTHFKETVTDQLTNQKE